MSKPLILVTGATGTIGRQVAAQLLAQGHRVRVAVRDPAKAEMVALQGEAGSFDEAVAMVRAALAKDDRHRAVWILHRLLLGVMDRKGALSFSGWKTNKDYLRECRRDHPDYPLLSELTLAYDHIVYAHREMVEAPLSNPLQSTIDAREASRSSPRKNAR